MRRLIFWTALVAFLAFAIYDDPIETARKAYADFQCRMNDTCMTALPMILPGVRVLFVDESLATREGRRVAILADAWPFCDDATGNVYRVPKFFETDFASIPGWAQFYVRPDDKAIVGAAIVHDWLYAVGAENDASAKQKADEMFRYELGQSGVNMVKRNVMFAAVSMFGGEAFGTAEEMRFRNPENGNPYIGAKPEVAVIDTVAPQCTNFLEKYWDPVVASGGPQGHYLSPDFIEEWIDLN